MKKSITILLFFALFFSQIGYRLVYLVQQHQLKEEAEEQLFAIINDDQFEQITEEDNRNNIIWEEEGKEFFLNGQLYDVAKKEIVNGKTIFFCLNDTKEEQLIEAMLKKTTSNTDNGPAKHGKHTVKFQLSDFTLLSAKTIINNFFIAQSYRDYTAAINTITKEVNTPPPNNNLYFQKLTL